MAREPVLCDHCRGPVYYGEMPTLVATGEVIGGSPIVLLLCPECAAWR